MNKPLLAALAAFILLLGYCIFTPGGVEMRNKYLLSMQKAEDRTDYKTLQTVENTARAMMTSYESDRIYWEQYRNSEVAKEKEWAVAAKIKANRTAVNYNEYILKNNFVWREGVPEDIKSQLPIIQ
jgi:hypothetical protein